ncbi:MAG: D-glycero-beta-D-manno-heptose-7-phosphate kinase [Ignavibacteria bacterium]|nr:D-glycero-beta-D-manno-heptose-7-phosphate kinase [Ignavibacteria bacterium]
MNFTNLNSIFSKANGKKIVVIGDIMLDRYLLGNVTRISPEAPVQVFDIGTSENKLGGAANVAYNIKTLGAEPLLIGVCGNDDEGKILKKVFEDLGISTEGIIAEANRNTTCKTRVIAAAHHLIRLDSESRTKISEDSSGSILKILEKTKNDFDIIILEDYNKGVLTKPLIHSVIEFAKENNKKILVDPKFENFFEYKDVFLFKPNRKELEDAILKRTDGIDELIERAKDFIKKINCKNLVLTLGEHGMLLIENNNDKIEIVKVPTQARKVSDVSGAGDTVISTIAVCLAGGAEVKESVIIANFAAGLVVEEVGIVPIYKDILIEHLVERDV